jgi:hypothetical protein
MIVRTAKFDRESIKIFASFTFEARILPKSIERRTMQQGESSENKLIHRPHKLENDTPFIFVWVIILALLAINALILSWLHPKFLGNGLVDSGSLPEAGIISFVVA